MAYVKTVWANGATALSAEHFNNIEDGVTEALEKAEGNVAMWAYISNLVYPVGSIYMTATLSTVAEVEAALGGTWVAWGAGRVPVGVDTTQSVFDTVEETGGSTDAVLLRHNHTFTGEQMPRHNHVQDPHTHASGAEANSYVLADSNYNVSNEAFGSIAGETYKVPRISFSSNGFRKAANTAETTATNREASAGTPTGTISYAGDSPLGRYANLQPYITCYMYKRTA